MWEEVLESDTCAPAVAAARVAQNTHRPRMAGVGEHRHRPQLERLAVRSGQLVCVRSAGVEPASRRSRHRRGMDANDVEQRPARSSRPIVGMMMRSRQAVVDYMTPLGLASPHGDGSSLRPGAVGRRSASGRTGTRATTIARTRSGIGFDRTAQRQQRGRAICAARSRHDFANLRRVGDDYLLWFHHVPWDYRLRYRAHRCGTSSSRATIARRRPGARRCGANGSRCAAVRRSDSGSQRSPRSFVIQEQEAKWWRDACIAYFQSVSQPAASARRRAAGASALDYYKALRFPYVPGAPR